jgi:hypothetical protein
MNEPVITQKVVLAFLIGLIVGGLIIGTLDAYGKNPLSSKAFIPPLDDGPTAGDPAHTGSSADAGIDHGSLPADTVSGTPNEGSPPPQRTKGDLVPKAN